MSLALAGVKLLEPDAERSERTPPPMLEPGAGLGDHLAVMLEVAALAAVRAVAGAGDRTGLGGGAVAVAAA